MNGLPWVEPGISSVCKDIQRTEKGLRNKSVESSSVTDIQIDHFKKKEIISVEIAKGLRTQIKFNRLILKKRPYS